LERDRGPSSHSQCLDPVHALDQIPQGTLDLLGHAAAILEFGCQGVENFENQRDLGADIRVISPGLCFDHKDLIVCAYGTSRDRLSIDQFQDCALSASPGAGNANRNRVKHIVQHGLDRSLGNSAKR